MPGADTDGGVDEEDVVCVGYLKRRSRDENAVDTREQLDESVVH